MKNKILYVASEVSPYAMSGGLADVAGSLSKEILKLGYDISIIMPRYREVVQKLEFVMEYPIYMYGNEKMCTIKKHEQEIGDKKLVTYFVDNDYYFNRNGMYCHHDEAERYAFFDKAVTEFTRRTEPNVVHLNDWQTGPIATLIRDKLCDTKTKIIYTIHNLEYNGQFSKDALYALDLDESYFNYTKLEFYGDFSFTKAGILYSDVVTTVSPTYAEEIQTTFFGFRYENILKEKSKQGKLIGILNGIDTEEYNPEKDKEIYKNYSATTVDAKTENKTALQKDLELPIRDVPVLSVISRVVSHKGFDILVESIADVIEDDIQFILLGIGEQHYINRFRLLKEKYPNKISINDEFNHALAKKIYAASDIIIMPSMSEPCGLSQMIACRYGTVPVVRSTGGLKDTIIDYIDNPEKGNGFIFEGRRTSDLTGDLKRALYVNRNKKEWKKLSQKDMKEDYSWAKSAREYEKIYK